MTIAFGLVRVTSSRCTLTSTRRYIQPTRLLTCRLFTTHTRWQQQYRRREDDFIQELRNHLRRGRATRSTGTSTVETVEAEPVTSSEPMAETTSNWTEWSLSYAAALIVRRQLEPLNIFLGFEQANRYTIEDDYGRPVAYLAEEETTLSSTIARQILRTRRPFRAVVLDQEGRVVLKLQRPFTFINTRLYISDANDRLIGEVWQRWHLWRRRYDLFIGQRQFAEIDAGFLAWRFGLYNEEGQVIGCVDRRFGGFAREIFTDTGQYALLFHPDYLRVYEGTPPEAIGPVLNADERAVALACAICIDFDYFSRHSTHGPGLFSMPFIGMGGHEDLDSDWEEH